VTSAEDEPAYLWTDSRYWNEAGLQLEPGLWSLQKAGLPDTKTIPKWLAERAVKQYRETGGSKPLCVGMDPFVNAASFAKEVEDAFKEAVAAEVDLPPPKQEGDGADAAVVIGVLDTAHENLIDPIWGDERPAIPTSKFRVHPLEYAGMTVADKVAKIRKEMTEKKATMSVFTTLDDVAYLFNVRSKGDVDTCPVGIAYGAVTMDDVRLYCDPRKLTEEVREHLRDVQLMPYDSIVDDVKAHCADPSGHNKVWMDKSRTNYGLISLVPEKLLIDSKTALTDMKAAKNEAEMEGMRRAHIVDGAAMAKFMAWLEHEIVTVGRKVSEVEIDEVLTGCRAEQPGFVEVSFPTIAGVGPNGAIIHYRAAENEIMRYLDQSSPILIDSGGQYLYGTTDVTRSWHFGAPTPEYVDAYTRVLKGNIGLDEMIFPEATPGFALDIYARRWLWDAEKDYGHGTGHGVGAALNVHEGPMSISPRWGNKEGLKAGMVVSNEPGYYEDGNFGIRIENLLEIQCLNPEDSVEKAEEDDAKTPAKKKFLRFKKLTMIPIQLNLIDLSLMTTRELDWIDAYHAEVFEKVSPLLEPGSPALAWLTKSCQKISRQ
jgi:Xaa-Pro aminopeptidase